MHEIVITLQRSDEPPGMPQAWLASVDGGDLHWSTSREAALRCAAHDGYKLVALEYVGREGIEPMGTMLTVVEL